MFRFIWLTFRDLDELPTNENDLTLHIPYNCRFFSVKATKEHQFDVSALYHVSRHDPLVRQTNFGKWTKAGGIQMSKDFFLRRFDLNGTNLNVGIAFRVSFCL